MAKESYSDTLKKTSVFGGTQFFQVIIGLIKLKFVAILLGSSGMGTHNLYLSSTAIFITIFSLGLNASGVRELSLSYSNGDDISLAKSLRGFRLLVVSSAILGGIFTYVFSASLSTLTFGTEENTHSFQVLAVFVAFTILSKGNVSVLQGHRRIKAIASSSLVSAVLGLLVSVPLYYIFEFNGIMPAIFFSGLVMWFITEYHVRRISGLSVSLSISEFKELSMRIISLGIAMLLAQIFGQIAIFSTNYFLRIHGSINDIGYYNAALGMTAQIVALLFAALASDYYPRLVAVSNDKIKINQTVNEQAVIITLLAIPLLSCFVVLSEFVVRLLLSREFEQIFVLVDLLAIGAFLKVGSFSLGYISFAKNEKRTFFLLEGIFNNALTLSSSIIGYLYFGLVGLGISYVISYSIYLVVVSCLSIRRYGIVLSKNFVRIFVFGLTVLIALLITKEFESRAVRMSISLIIEICTVYICVKRLNSLSGFISDIMNWTRNQLSIIWNKR